jgi:hypothetical protein
MSEIDRPLEVLSAHREMGRSQEGPENVRVLAGERFLYGSFDHGREQVLHIREHDRVSLLRYWLDWLYGDVESDGGHRRTPQSPSMGTAEHHPRYTGTKPGEGRRG